MDGAEQNRTVRPSLATRGVHRLRSKLGLQPKVKMTPEAAKFIAEYREWLGRCIDKADEYLAAHEECDVLETLKGSKDLMDELAELQEKSGKPDLDLYLPIHTMLYLICRKLRPQRVVETGVEKGGSSHMILQALDKNSHGRLWSIDIGSVFVHKGHIVSNIGPLVEDRTKSRWNLIKGDAQKVMGGVLAETGEVDMFCAGQGHTYKVQKDEGGHAWPSLRSGGVFVLDRADWNDNKYLGEFMAEHSDSVAWHETYKEGSSADPFEFTVIVKK